MTLDGTDFRIHEPQPFDRKWYSHKFKGPGVRYEVGVCIQTGHMCWVNGPYPCGEWTDLKIARSCIVEMLPLDKCYLRMVATVILTQTSKRLLVTTTTTSA
jgi:hypothetical protein